MQKELANTHEDRSIHILSRVDAHEFAHLYSLLNKINVPLKSSANNNSRKGFSKHRSMTFGWVKLRYSRAIAMSRPSVNYPDIYNEMKRLASVIAPDFKFCSIHLNKNVVCPPHKDDNNCGKSLIVSFGDYEGCELVVDGLTLDAKFRPIIFDGGRIEHMNLPTLTGTKYSLVFFNTTHGNKAQEHDSNSQ
jgi:hypothetical protein